MILYIIFISVVIFLLLAFFFFLFFYRYFKTKKLTASWESQPQSVPDPAIPKPSKMQELVGVLKSAKQCDSLYDQRKVLEDLEETAIKIRDRLDQEAKLQIEPQYQIYYTDTLIKLFRSYQDLERKNDESSEAVLKMKAEIIGLLPDAISYYEHYLERLFSSQYLDVSSDVDVLKVISQNINQDQSDKN